MTEIELVATEQITEKIYIIRGTKVMLDRDLASLYKVETKYLKQSVRKNINRFPEMRNMIAENEELRKIVEELKQQTDDRF
ncbi:ORF6N domain-containing protein [Desulfobacter hydrogenophilus]|uniref:ORF6N domain-containing protein n=1 Tax=Desulfobacter hydrogenophilus TaxID=2291 RepID=A0A328F8Q7_9BACT|nr:ORF6N domain-containing protein [Desulfobacter hydrogenophilus]NDY72088.1 ORF6N domain-containing protein [Desulfobacter hydrogenophilus]QBH14814.1 ORF6N domain-containing protein [Desulfobacter hydrogenophilus]RAM00030.1 ORF6N domain-containing protein [Desulfobacter hydrogenophilus]